MSQYVRHGVAIIQVGTAHLYPQINMQHCRAFCRDLGASFRKKHPWDEGTT
jgi:hypothetical protein